MSTAQHASAPGTLPIGGYAKGITALTGVAVALGVALKDDVLSVPEASTLAIALLGAIATYAIANRDHGPMRYAKTIVALLAAAAGVLPTYLTGWSGLSLTDWAITGVQVLFAALVYVVPNAGAVVTELRDQGLELGVVDVPEEAALGGERVVADERAATGLMPAVTATATPADAMPGHYPTGGNA